MKLYLLLVLISSTSVFSLENKNDFFKSIVESFITDVINNYFKELSKYDPFYVDYVNTSYFNYNVQLYKFSSKGFSNVDVSHVKAWGLFTKHISLKLSAPKIATSVEEFSVTGGNSNVYGSSKLQLDYFDVWIDTKLNLLTHRVEQFEATFKLQHGNASIVVFRDNVDISQNVTDGVNHYLNFSFNTDYQLQKEMSNYLKQLLERIW